MAESDRGDNSVPEVIAPPDDPEFFCGDTIASWAAEGRNVTYCLLTREDKGADRPGGRSRWSPATPAATTQASSITRAIEWWDSPPDAPRYIERFERIELR